MRSSVARCCACAAWPRSRRPPQSSPIGAAAIGLAPVWLTFAIAIPMHLGFTLLSPARLIPFTFASLGLLSLATVHPLLGVW